MVSPVRILARWASAVVAGLTVTIGAGVAAHAAPSSSAGWSIEPTPTPAFAGVAVLSSVSCGSPRACIAVGYHLDVVGAPVPLAEQWNGSRWAIQRTPDPRGATSSFLFGVSCATPRSCAAVGSVTGGTTGTVPLVERWNGIRWTIERVSGPIRRVRRDVGYLAAVSCPSQSVCAAVGYVGNSNGTAGMALAERWTRARGWTVDPAPSPAGAGAAFLSGVSCSSARRCTAVGDLTTRAGASATLAERRTPDGWKIQPTPTPAAATLVQLTGVSCPSRSFCTAAGFFEAAGIDVMLAERWNGGRWVIGHTRYPAGAREVELADVSCPSASSCTAVGYLNDTSGLDAPLAERWTRRGWTIQPTPAIGNSANAADAILTGVSCPSATRCTAVGTITALAGTGIALAEGDVTRSMRGTRSG